MIQHSCRDCRAGNPRRCGRAGGPTPPRNGRNDLHHHHHHQQQQRPSTTYTWSLLLVCCTLLLLLPHGVAAGRIYGASELLPRELLFDHSAPPMRMPLLAARQDLSSESASTTIKPKAKSSATESSISTATETGTVALPRPFDSSIGTNFTTSTCPEFFNAFLSNQTFIECLPFSLLLQTSNSFFTASRSLVRLTQTLDATCNVNLPLCTAAMSSWALEIQRPDRCASDLEMENPVVTQAYAGFLAYEPLYRAACLLDSSSGNYCFANAATNASAPTSSYIYYLPLGVELPGGSRPACTTCLQDTMAVFAEAAASSEQPLSGDYVGAAEQVLMTCGPNFVGASVQSTGASSSSTRAISRTVLGGILILSSVLVM